MRTVFKAQEVVKLWAEQKQTEARTGNGSIKFEGAKLYSYRTVIAELVANDAVILATAKYSVTTSKQQKWARQFTSHLTQHFVERLTA